MIDKEVLRPNSSEMINFHNQYRKVMPTETMIAYVLENFPFSTIRKYNNAIDKSHIFQLYRYNLVANLIYRTNLKEHFNLNKVNSELYNTVRDDVDTALCSVFFQNEKFPNIKPLHTLISDEMFYILLPFVIDRIEFTSLIKDKIKDAVAFHSNNKFNLNRRSYLAILHSMSEEFIMIGIEKDLITDTTDYKNVIFILQNLSYVKDKSVEMKNLMFSNLNKNKIDDDRFKVYRGYSIDKNENVILNRKERIQDARVSYSYAIEKNQAKSYGRLYKMTEEDFNTKDLLSINYRTCKLKDYFNNAERYAINLKLKPVVATYIVSLEDIIYVTLNLNNREEEVIILNDNPNLIRYEFNVKKEVKEKK